VARRQVSPNRSNEYSANFIKGFCAWLPLGSRLKTGANKLQGVVNNARAEFFALPPQSPTTLPPYLSLVAERLNVKCRRVPINDRASKSRQKNEQKL